MRQAIRDQCIVITVFSIAAIRLMQPYLPRGGALEYSLIASGWYRLIPIGTASRPGGLARYMHHRIYGTPFLALPLGFPSINNTYREQTPFTWTQCFRGFPRNLQLTERRTL